MKASNTKYNDLALLVSEDPCPAGAVFTRNVFKAAPVRTSYDTLQKRKHDGIRGVVVNSGCANAVTGKLGIEHAIRMAAETDKLFTSNQSTSSDTIPQTLVMSTGVIGQNLPMDRISGAIPKLQPSLGSSHQHWLGAASAICTTDTFPKLVSREFTLPSHPETTYSIAGMTKGAGMIHPNMATLLGIICTDAKIDPASIQQFLREANDLSFNCISIDGDTSTNDTVALLANGAAAPSSAKPLTFPTSGSGKLDEDATAFQKVLRSFMSDLAQLVVRDGEGATKFVKIRVRSDRDYRTAKRVAASIGQSSLVKTALYGKDANWGRILCATGYAPGVIAPDDSTGPPAVETVQPSRTSVSFLPTDGSAELRLLVRGEPELVDETRAREILEMEDLEILVRLEDDGEGAGSSAADTVHEAIFYTCDFSHEYVTINADYRT